MADATESGKGRGRGKGRGDGGKGGRGGRAPRRVPDTDREKPAERQQADSPTVMQVDADGHDSNTDDEGYLELAKRIAELLAAEVSSRESMTRRVGDLEDALKSAQKELADLRHRNERLNQQLNIAAQRM